MPASSDLRPIREHIAEHHRALHRIVTGAPFKRAVGTLDGEQLSSMPRGYVKDHPAARISGSSSSLPDVNSRPELRHDAALLPGTAAHLPAVAPLVRFLNTPLLARRKADLKVGLYTNTKPVATQTSRRVVRPPRRDKPESTNRDKP